MIMNQNVNKRKLEIMKTHTIGHGQYICANCKCPDGRMQIFLNPWSEHIIKENHIEIVCDNCESAILGHFTPTKVKLK